LSWGRRLGAIGLALGLGWIAREVPRSDWFALIGMTGLLCLGMVLWIRHSPADLSKWQVWGWGLVFRLMVLGTFPLWSDDVVRFYWDAWVAHLDMSPYAHTPRALLSQMPPDAQAVFPQLNSPDYYSVYLPLHQRLFQWALGGGVSLAEFTWRLQVLYLGLELLVWGIILWLSTPSQVNQWKWILWHPIFILEFIGNLHVEGLAAVFLVAFVVMYLSTNKMWISVVPFAIAVGWKWTPMLWVPLMWSIFPRRSRVQALVVGAVVLGGLTFPVAAHLVTMGQSLDLYFQRFEFNASIYYLVRDVGQWLLGYNPIGFVGPALSALAVVGILYWAFGSRADGYTRAYYSYGLYLAFATTVHPWYVIPWIVVGVLAGRSAPWFGLWCMVWSYHAYSLPEQPIWGYALLGCWVLGEEISWMRGQVPPATRGEDFLRKFFQYLSPNIHVEVKRR